VPIPLAAPVAAAPVYGVTVVPTVTEVLVGAWICLSVICETGPLAVDVYVDVTRTVAVVVEDVGSAVAVCEIVAQMASPVEMAAAVDLSSALLHFKGVPRQHEGSIGMDRRMMTPAYPRPEQD